MPEFKPGTRGKKHGQSRKALENNREKEIAKKLGGKAQPASGAGFKHKGDIKLEDFLVDSKATTGKTLVLPIAEIHKIVRHADGERRVPALYITFDCVADTTPSEWALIPASTFVHLIDNQKEDSEIRGSQY